MRLTLPRRSQWLTEGCGPAPLTRRRISQHCVCVTAAVAFIHGPRRVARTRRVAGGCGGCCFGGSGCSRRRPVDHRARHRRRQLQRTRCGVVSGEQGTTSSRSRSRHRARSAGRRSRSRSTDERAGRRRSHARDQHNDPRTDDDRRGHPYDRIHHRGPVRRIDGFTHSHFALRWAERRTMGFAPRL